jgi:anti-anti-sigma factor
MQVITLPTGNGSEIRLSGVVESHAASRLRAVLAVKLREKYPLLIVDCSELEHIDSCGMAAFVEYDRDARDFDGRLALVALKPSVETAFRTSRLDERILVMPSLNEAKALERTLRGARAERAHA